MAMEETVYENFLPSYRPRRLWPTLVFVAVLVLAGIFAWRVFSLYRQIQTGEINPALGYTSSSFTPATESFRALAKTGSSTTVAVATKDDPSLGSPQAPLTIVEFADFGCPWSQEVSTVLSAIARQYSDKVQIIYRDFPMDDLHPQARLAAEAGECAKAQGKFWEMHDVMFTNQNDLSSTALMGYAEEAGLNTQAFATCLNSGTFTAEVLADVAAGQQAGVVGTPTFFFNGVKVEGSIPFSIFDALVNAFLTA